MALVTTAWAMTREGWSEMSQEKAPHDGRYIVDGVPFKVFEGAVLPEGAVMEDVAADEPEAKADTEPENKADKAPAKK